ncbi:tetratricopeptide repeat protein [Mariprofundus ferrooxydans]|nr:tetratricopeptide repeat protein [Mariprofundus ferrooxydans]KON46622.1 hypothetical protein AL013_11945 [Mariprofundus ferrooxydans]
MLTLSGPGITLALNPAAAEAQVVVIFDLDHPPGKSQPNTADERHDYAPQGESASGVIQAHDSYNKGDFEEALSQLRKLIADNPKSAPLYYQLGLTYQGMLRYPEAVTAFSRSAELDPSRGDVYTHLGEMLYRLGRYPEALTALESGASKGAQPAYTAYMKGLVLIELADYPAAIDALQQAQSLDPEFTQKVTYSIGVAYSRQKDPLAAEETFRNAIAMDAGSPAGVYSDLSLQQLLDKQAARPLHLDIAYGLHYDDNVVLKPGPTVSAVFPSGQRDFVHVLSMHAGYMPESGGTSGFRADGWYYKSIHNKLSAMDVDGASMSLTPYMKTGAGTLLVEGRTDYYWIGRKRYLNIIGINPSFSFSINATYHGIVHAGYQSKQFLQQPLNIFEDRDAVNGSVGYTHYIYSDDKRAYLSVDYTFDTDNARGDNWDYLGHRLSLSALYFFNNDFTLRFNGEYYRQNYSNIHTVFGQKRRDSIFTLAPILRYNLTHEAKLLLQYTHVQAHSNLRVYQYARNITGMGFEYAY